MVWVNWPRCKPALVYNARPVHILGDKGMFQRVHRRGWHYLLLGTLAGLLFLTNLGGATLWDLDEGRNAECSFEMLEAGNWIVPTFNGQLRAHKPVLLYWLQMLAYAAF